MTKEDTGHYLAFDEKNRKHIFTKQIKNKKTLLTEKNGSRIICTLKDDKIDGIAISINSKGECCVGSYNNNLPHGYSVFVGSERCAEESYYNAGVLDENYQKKEHKVMDEDSRDYVDAIFTSLRPINESWPQLLKTLEKLVAKHEERKEEYFTILARNISDKEITLKSESSEKPSTSGGGASAESLSSTHTSAHKGANSP